MCVENIVFFKDNLEDNPKTNAGLLLDDENVICLCCGSIIEKGDYTIIERCHPSNIRIANEILLKYFRKIYSDELTEN